MGGYCFVQGLPLANSQNVWLSKEKNFIQVGGGGLNLPPSHPRIFYGTLRQNICMTPAEKYLVVVVMTDIDVVLFT